MTATTNAPVCYVRVRVQGMEPVCYTVSRFPCRIGRAANNDIVIPDNSVSSLHAVFAQSSQNGIVLEDQWSTNGIYLGTQRVSQIAIDHPLQLVMGRVKMDVALDPADLEVTSAAGSDSAAQATTFRKISPQPSAPSGGAPAASSSGAEGDVVRTGGYRVPLPAEPIAGTPAATISKLTGSGRQGIICPHCWHRFDVDEFLFIARHQSLIGDPVLGADAAQRFLPSRFTKEGNALDVAGMSCPDMACPRCHLRIPQAASEMPPLFLSIVGATASGKSYFLTSMTWELRNTLSRNFAISFTDTDAVNNQILNDFEETVFLHADDQELVALRKTELQGELYNQVLLDNMLINLPKPFMFTITPAEHHPKYEQVRQSMSRTLVLYDNAGEHFEPGMDSVDNPTTQHLLHSDTIFFLFDPTKDVRFRRRLSDVNDPQLAATSRVQRQEIILTEMINRIKKYSGMRSGRKTAKTLIILVSKFDTWKQLLDAEVPREPWQWDADSNSCALDVATIKNVSFALRHLLEQVCPEVVSTAESFAGEVLYLPNSALGHSPELNEATGMIGIRPRDVEPLWVAVPMLYFFYERGFIQDVRPENRVRHAETPASCKLSGDIYFVTLPGLKKPLQVPLSYAGSQLRCPGTDMWFSITPESERGGAC
ncbi:MAG: FHA domain-containing protein [Lentisphaerae bacterium]|nr:FHA domain-containing protein [Lentisphaerota bacterium]